MDESAFNPARRRLCRDGACIGLIGDDGRCRVCGLTADGARAPNGIAPGPTGDGSDDHPAPANFIAAGDDDDDGDDRASAAGDQAAGAPSDGESAFRPDRRLCEDGDCIGVLDAAGLCSVCGRRAG